MPPAPSLIHLPNGYTFTVTPVFGGVAFRSQDLNPSHNVFPPGWTIVLRTEKNPSRDVQAAHQSANLFTLQREASPEPTHQSIRSPPGLSGEDETKDVPSHRFKQPTLNNDIFFISSIFLPSSNDFRPASSPTRQIAMMIWATLWWYFHQPEPSPSLTTDESALTPEAGKPKGEWRIYVKQEGVLKGRNLMCKLERMGLLATEESFVGEDNADIRQPSGWQEMFVSRRSFWQLDPRIFLFTLAPTTNTPTFTPFAGNSPHQSRPVSPSRDFGGNLLSPGTAEITNGPPQVTRGPFTSSSHLPTYFPPHPVQYTFTNGVRHPIRQKPPRQGEVFYIRHVPSVDEHLSFRVPILPSQAPPDQLPELRESVRTFHRKSRSMSSLSDSSLHGRPSMDGPTTDVETLHRWMNNPRVNASWGVAGPQATQEKFLRNGLKSRHSFPVFGCWNGKPFGYFEIYWAKEDPLGRLLGGQVDNFDRGIHCLVGEEEFRGPHRVAIWLSALVHYCWLADNRTQTVMLEPRVDNKKFISYLRKAGFYKEGEVAFPHKQSAVMKIKRDSWEAPAL